MAGPLRIIESMMELVTLALVMNTYVWPIAVSGIVATIMLPIMEPATLVVLSPLTKVTKKVDGIDVVVVNVKVMSGAAGIP